MPRRIAALAQSAVLIGLIGPTLPGCRRGAGELRPENATVAPPRALFPRGTTIPAAGLGVDLVRSPDRDASAARASHAESNRPRRPIRGCPSFLAARP